MKPFAAAAFFSAALLFLMQPVAGRALLPLYGGSASVWTACLLFFQTGLLAAYGLAHWVGRWSLRAQAATFIAGIVTGWALLSRSAPLEAGPGDPMWEVMFSLASRYGAGYLAVGMSSPVLQTWLTAVGKGSSPYWLYAYSNAGALTALLSYPTLVEPTMSLQAQHRTLGVLFAAALLLATICWRQWSRTQPSGGVLRDEPAPAAASAEPPMRQRATWFFLAFGGSATLLGLTNEMCREVAVVPFLWILPLTLYLSTFIYCFRRSFSANKQQLCFTLAVGVLLGTAVLAAGNALLAWFQVVLLALVLLAVCFCCHGLLANSKPSPGRLTDFYLILAAGGAAGSGFVALLAPRLFSGYDELPWVLSAMCLAAAFELGAEAGWRNNPSTKGILAGLLLAACGGLALAMTGMADESPLEKRRNFYGTLQVMESKDVVGLKRTLRHGRVLHGLQYLEPDKEAWPTAYYGPSSGVGIELQRLPVNSTVAVLGLGVGTLATYAKRGDTFIFFEIDGNIIEIASTSFTYLTHCKGKVQILPGDARLVMQQRTSRGEEKHFDAIVVDTFSSGAIPMHMLTLEAANLFRNNLKPTGKILYHISNQSLDLEPVVRGLAFNLGMHSVRVDSTAQPERGINGATWMILNSEVGKQPETEARRHLLWTDSDASLWRALRWR